MRPLLEALGHLGAAARSVEGSGCPPCEVSGPLRGGKARIACPTSQFLTSLLVACPLAAGDSEITVTELNEAPYVEMTLRWLDLLKVEYECDEEMTHFRIPGGQSYPAFTRRVPADWSSATFFLAAAAITGGEVELAGLDLEDAQGDKAVLGYLEAMGASVERGAESVRLRGGALRGARLDLNDTPDALPAMAVAAAFARGRTELENVPQARLKETDRIAVMAEELGKLGVRCEELPDGLVVQSRGAGGVRGGRVDGRDDHRVVMALALAGLAAREPVTVEGAEAMSVTFPDFVERMAALGARMEKR
jgi:3-phosphoshikimate 1-carboxyvinyltransferase